MNKGITRIPWDSQVFGMPVYEISRPTRKNLESACRNPGHYTVKVGPFVPKKDLQECGFYYCDTLLTFYCKKKDFVHHHDEKVRFSRTTALSDLLVISRGAFPHGRFHRDFAMDPRLADRRYDRWLRQLHGQKQVFGLYYGKALAGFIGVSGNKMVLHALATRFRGKRLAKFFWSAVCRELFRQGHRELCTSISAANMPVLNLYLSLGFSFRDPMDVYHRKTA